MTSTNLLNQETTTDRELVRLAQDGDHFAFEALYDRYMPQVYKKVWYSIPEQDVEDIAQDIFIAVMKSLKSFRGDSKFTTWLWTITKRQIADYYRSRKWKARQAEVSEDISDLNILSTINPGVENLDDIIMVRNAIKKIPEHYQEVIYLRFIDGLKFDEIAVEIHKSNEATKSLFRRAISELQKVIGPNYG